jgi:hypothetical protein
MVMEDTSDKNVYECNGNGFKTYIYAVRDVLN